MTSIYNNLNSKKRRKELRKNQTDAELLLWNKIRSKQLNGFKFYRQYSVGPYMLDFFCPKLRLAVELDGSQHMEKRQLEHDNQRTAFLKQHNILVERFWDNDVMKNINGVIDRLSDISTRCLDNSS